MTLKVINVVGARPQFIKCAMVCKAIEKVNSAEGRRLIENIVLHTGQHYDVNMSDIFLDELELKVDYNLGIKENSHAKMTAGMLTGIEAVLLKHRPDVVIVYGDTNSTLAAALTASKMRIPVAHVEAGLRSYNMSMPEEVNRILVDRLARWLFSPSQDAVDNLNSECRGFFHNKNTSSTEHPQIIYVGDVMYDAFLMCHKKAIEKSATPSFGDSSFGTFFLATVHRGENTDDPDKLRAIIEALDEISLKRRVVFPIHPRTRKAMDTFGIKVKNIQIVPPVGYYDMLRLLDRCEAVFTDSGGLQKESYFARKLCVTLRDETEWGELVESGYNILTGASKNRIVQASKEFVTRRVDWNSNLYGDGCAGEKIVRTIMDSPRQ